LKIGQDLTKLCVDYVGLLFLAHPVDRRASCTYDFTSLILYHCSLA